MNYLIFKIYDDVTTELVHSRPPRHKHRHIIVATIVIIIIITTTTIIIIDFKRHHHHRRLHHRRRHWCYKVRLIWRARSKIQVRYSDGCLGLAGSGVAGFPFLHRNAAALCNTLSF